MQTQRLSEDDLCRAFAEKVADSEDFKNWILSRTKFAAGRFSSRLLKQEQALARPRVLPDRWWRHWFWRITELEKEHETDVLLWFADDAEGLRFVLHVELKLGSKLTAGQAASYAPRARHVLKYEKRLPHQDFATVFIAPTKTILASGADSDLFDAVISLEEVGVFIQDFARATTQATPPATKGA
ncbi:MAG: hypothetical protein K0M49_10595 [Arenimonas sp.]|nr:hypothetical protein [Rhizobium sp.]MBW8446067.1 hypothetical protein [Arenimonas sp.]